MRKVLTKIGYLFSIPFLFIAVVLFSAALMLYVPIDYIKYKKSPYYKIERKKYDTFDAVSKTFKLYNIIAKNNLPIKYINDPTTEGIGGRFVYNKTLIIIALSDWVYKDGCWKFKIDEDDENLIPFGLTFDEDIEQEIEAANHVAGDIICEDAVILIKADMIEYPENLPWEEINADRFIVYEENPLQALKNFIENR